MRITQISGQLTFHDLLRLPYLRLEMRFFEKSLT